jgi:hypothetical protein
MSRAAAEIEPVSRMLSSSLVLPGPIRAPDSKTMLTLTRAMTPTVPCSPVQIAVTFPGVLAVTLDGHRLSPCTVRRLQRNGLWSHSPYGLFLMCYSIGKVSKATPQTGVLFEFLGVYLITIWITVDSKKYPRLRGHHSTMHYLWAHTW